MHPFWDKVVEYCPRSIAPNLLTFVGFLFTLVTFFMFSYEDYEFYASAVEKPEVPLIPSWVFIVGAINIFLAYTLDGIDGKQARRTGTSSPLGELFDHGLDSYTAGLMPITLFSIFGRGEKHSVNVFRMYYILWNVLVNFYIPHFEKYNTGILFLPWGYDYSMWTSIFMLFFTGVFGQQMWQFTGPGGLNAGHLFEILIYVSSLSTTIPVAIFNIHKAYKNGYGPLHSFSEAARPSIPIFIFLILSIIWVQKSPSDILEKDPRAVYFLTSTIFSNICCRLIVAQMSNTRSEIFNSLLYPFGAAVLLSLLLKNDLVELAFVYGLCLITTLAHIHYGTCLVRQMCRHFRINCFTIRDHSE
ncbi:ethanolaminephosphotransferase 1-like isoform X2 [Agrilus planipennis]|nr:ethanolaminephosphotransferase 1-like isoform X2 [Agrilus planipennis]